MSDQNRGGYKGSGYSEKDLDKLVDVIKNPGKYGVDPDDKGSCWDNIFQLILLATAAIGFFQQFS